MATIAIILTAWCVPSAVLVAVVSWHRYKAQLLIRKLHLDDMVLHAHQRA